jgi:molybdopterin-binding protein
MKLSARNQIKGKITNIETGSVNNVVVLDIGNNIKISAMITKESVNNLGLKVGDQAYAVIKASEVMIGIDG